MDAGPEGRSVRKLYLAADDAPSGGEDRFSSRGVAGLVHVRFYIEPDGKVTIGEVLSSPDEKLAREVIRVIRASKGHWVPRRVRGVPQRTAYEYRINFT